MATKIGTWLRGNVIVGSDHGSDDIDSPTTVSVKSASAGAPVRLPYPEATYWGAARMGARKLFEAAATVLGFKADTTLHTADTTAFTADYDGTI